MIKCLSVGYKEENSHELHTCTGAFTIINEAIKPNDFIENARGK